MTIQSLIWQEIKRYRTRFGVRPRTVTMSYETLDKMMEEVRNNLPDSFSGNFEIAENFVVFGMRVLRSNDCDGNNDEFFLNS